ncbi:MAG: AI-2E family transporter [bacterium]|nr:AI-2E family transporter [bacterium]
MKMTEHKPRFYFFLLLFFWVFLLVFFILLPFVQVLVLAMVLAVTFTPLYEKILNNIRWGHSIAALITTIIILTLVVVPVVFLGIQIFQEATGLYTFAVTGGIETFLPNILDGISNIFPQAGTALSKITPNADEQFKAGLQWLLQNIGPVFSSATSILINFFILIIALYYLLKDGKKLKNFIILLSPLPVTYDEQILKKLEATINAVIKGMLVIALAQGVMTSIGFAIFGVPNAILWGSVATVASLIPNLGTALVLFPAIIYIYFFGNTLSAIGLLIWGMLFVGLIDNYLGPKLIERKVGIHPFLILLSILGGLSFFGPIGFLFGPLALSLFFAMLDVYRMLVDEKA